MPDTEPKEPALQPIGNLATRILRSALNAASTRPAPEIRLPALPTTGTRALAPVGSSETGPRRGEIGFARPPTTEAMIEMSQVNLDSIAMALVPSRLASRLAWKLGGNLETRELHLTGEEPLNQSDVGTTLANLTPLMRPASEAILAMYLTEVRTLTVRPAGVEDELVVSAWVNRLRAWPADVAIWALRAWPSQSKWWPAWKEIEELMSRRAHERLVLYRRLKARLQP